MDRRSLFIAVILVGQLLLPLRYYAFGDDPYDERFSWRMFSPIRMVKCGARFEAAGKPVDLNETFHSAWITLVGRGRLDVTEAVGARICLINPGDPVTLLYVCEGVDGERTTLSKPDHDICPDGRW
ncbi:MAG: hypothetical protein H6739_03375 [Alphaproteobacteria bacterium]|nr:hypothetical protein [Alphaproteobacteria bacterium]